MSDGITLSKIRQQLKADLEAETFLGKPILEVWINEDEPAEPGNTDSWDVCIKAARDADLVLVLFNGNAGWAEGDESLGICHAEFITAFSESPGKVSLVSIFDPSASNLPSTQKDVRFQNDIKKANLFRGTQANNRENLVAEVKKAVFEALLGLALKGAAEVKKSKYNAGPALDWTRLDFKARQITMATALAATIAPDAKDNRSVVAKPFGNTKMLFAVSAVPAAMTVASAREMVGQPFLGDHTFENHLAKGVSGPIHAIACHRTVSESQALSMLGFPDATVVSGSFGVYVADRIQKIQILFLANCRDESSIRHNWQRLVDWLNETGEAELLVERAKSRTRIVKAIAGEIIN
jgi:hypothetical protein